MGCPCCEGKKREGETVKNLQTVYQGETDASRKYDAYSLRARTDGYLGVSCFFAALAFSERIHAARHRKVGAMLGSALRAEVNAFEGTDVVSMLQNALAGETEESQVIYPSFIKVSTDENIMSATASFEGAMKTESEHARLCTEALAHLDDWKESLYTFCVCSFCGWTTEKPAPETCPVCASPVANFIQYP